MRLLHQVLLKQKRL